MLSCNNAETWNQHLSQEGALAQNFTVGQYQYASIISYLYKYFYVWLYLLPFTRATMPYGMSRIILSKTWNYTGAQYEAVTKSMLLPM